MDVEIEGRVIERNVLGCKIYWYDGRSVFGCPFIFSKNGN